MPTRGPYRLSTGIVWGLAALLAAALSPATGRAGCGDYIVFADAHPSAAADPHAAPPKHPAPCHGPSCQQKDGPVAPAAPAAPTGPGSPDAILTAPPPADPEPVGRVVPASLLLPFGPPSDVFRPPRLV